MEKNSNEHRLYQIGILAAILAALMLLIGGVALAITGNATATEDIEQLLTAIDQKRLILTTGYLAITLVSLFDIFTVPGLYTVLRRDGYKLVVIAAITAVIGDLLGVISGLIQTALLPLSTRLIGSSSAMNTMLLSTAETVVTLESVISSAGFVLVGVSFLCFGMAILRGTFGKWIGWVAIAAGIFSILGQLPSLAALFMIANIAYLLWYIGISTRFYRLATNAKQDTL